MFQLSLPKPIWDITDASWVDVPSNPRFAMWNAGTSSTADDAVFDKETGLVWERSPATDRKDFGAAVVYSTTRVVARRKGWRLPALEELLSLAIPANTNPTLPAGHPFLNIKLDYFYWSMNQGIFTASNPQMWGYNFGNADTSSIVLSQATCYTWLVRGGYGRNYPH
jgi:hypothetical protein